MLTCPEIPLKFAMTTGSAQLVDSEATTATTPPSSRNVTKTVDLIRISLSGDSGVRLVRCVYCLSPKWWANPYVRSGRVTVASLNPHPTGRFEVYEPDNQALKPPFGRPAD